MGLPRKDVFVPTESKGEWTILSGRSFGGKDPHFAVSLPGKSGREEL